MDAQPIIARIARTLAEQRLEAILIGNAAAALQGAPVTTIDFDFMFCKTPANIRKLKALAKSLGAVLFKPFYPASGLHRISRDEDSLQLDFMSTVDGIKSFERLRSRAARLDFEGHVLLVADLADVVASKRAAPKRRITRREKLQALKAESERVQKEQIRAWQRLPPEQRTNFLRKRIGPLSSCL